MKNKRSLYKSLGIARASNCKLYRVWWGMKQRCLDVNAINYKWYGAKGIKICELWIDDFASFYLWAISAGYKQGLTLDRIDNNGNYSPLNCRWISLLEQQANRGNTNLALHEGQMLTLPTIAKLSGKKLYILVKEAKKSENYKHSKRRK